MQLTPVTRHNSGLKNILQQFPALGWGVGKTPLPLAHLQLNHFPLCLCTCVSPVIARITFQFPEDKCTSPQNCLSLPQNCLFLLQTASFYTKKLGEVTLHMKFHHPSWNLCISYPPALQFLRLELPPALQMFGFLFHLKLIFCIYIKYGFIFHFAPKSPCLLPLRAAVRFSAGCVIPAAFQRGKK